MMALTLSNFKIFQKHKQIRPMKKLQRKMIKKKKGNEKKRWKRNKMGNIRKMIKELTMIIFLISFNFPKLMNIGVCKRESNMPPRERAVKRERDQNEGKERREIERREERERLEN